MSPQNQLSELAKRIFVLTQSAVLLLAIISCETQLNSQTSDHGQTPGISENEILLGSSSALGGHASFLGTIGATKLQNLATDLESSLKDTPVDLPVTLLEDTGAELGHVLGMIRGIPTSACSKETPIPSRRELPENLVVQLQALESRLEDFDSEADDLLREILKQVEGHRIHGMLQGVKKLIGGYDLEAAADELRPLIAKINAITEDDKNST